MQNTKTEEKQVTPTVGIDTVLGSIMSVVVPGLTYGLMVMASGKPGACAVTHTLKTLGLGNMKAGAVSLVAISKVSDVASHAVVQIPTEASLKQRIYEGEALEDVLSDIDTFPLSATMREKLKKKVIAYASKREEVKA